MPNRPKKIKRPWRPERKPFERNVDNQKFYNSTAWRKVSALHKKNNPFCVECLKENKYVPVEVTDHIVRIEEGGPKLASENLQSLCHKCHNSKSGREAHGKRRNGEERFNNNQRGQHGFNG